MAFTLLNTFLVKSLKLAIQKQFIVSNFSVYTNNITQKVVTKTAYISRNLKLPIATLFAIITLSFASYASELPVAKIAIVDVPYVLDNSIAVKHLRASIDKISEQFYKELSSKETEFKQMEAALLKKREITKPEQFDSEVEEFYKKLSTFQHDTQKKKEKLERAHADAIDLVHQNTIKIVHELAKERKFNLAVPMSHTLYSVDAMNITAEVTSRLNNSLKEVNLKF